ncbi:MAG: ABC transporter permease [Romboutsia sp.]|uniref:ABC transporter permease n=1 Tax=Romboutsia sp. TaxID=1965302 RepID=UPI003F2CAD60
MKTLVQLSIAYLKKQKSRTTMLIAGVALAVMLIFGFDVISESQSKNQLNTIYDLYGSYHATFSNLDKKDITKLENDKSITKINSVANLGNVSYENGIQMQLESVDKGYIDAQNYSLKEGKLPSRDGEIVIEERALEEMGLSKHINQNIKLKLKKEYKDENGINKIFIENRIFKIVGILEKPKLYYEDVYYLKAFTYFKEGTSNVIPDELISYVGAISLKTGTKNIDKTLNEIIVKNNIGRLDYEPNGQLTMALSEYSASKNNEANKDIKLLIIVTAILLIYNLFNISLTEIIKQIGTLRTIGASKRHIRGILSIQSMTILVVGVTLGVVGGIIFSYLGMKVFRFTGTDIDTSTAQVYISSKSIIEALKVGGITVLISSIIPIYMAGRISPIDALKKSDTSKKRKKERLHHKVIRKVFGISGEMAYKNVWRNKIRAFISILSISIGGILFIFTVAVASSDSDDKINVNISNMGDNAFNLKYGTNADTNIVGYTDKDVHEISNIEGVNSVSYKYQTGGFLEVESNKLYKEYKKYNGITEQNKKIEVPVAVKMYDDKQLSVYEQFIKEGKISSINNSEDEYPNVVLFNNYYDILEDHRAEEVIEKLKIGDVLTIKVPVFENDALIYKDCKVRVSALVDTRWIFEGDSSRGRYPEIIMSQNDLAKITGENIYSQISIVAESGKEKEIDKELNSILENKPWVFKESKLQYQDERDEYQKRHLNSKAIINILILLISSLNIFCSMRTSFLLRTNEFSTLRAIGMSSKNVKGMILKEACIYGIVSSLISAIIGSYKYYNYVTMMNRDYAYAFNMDTIEVFKIPIAEILIFSLIAIGICTLSAYLSNKKIEKTNIIEGLNASE